MAMLVKTKGFFNVSVQFSLTAQDRGRRDKFLPAATYPVRASIISCVEDSDQCGSKIIGEVHNPSIYH